ncbi:hypothetical protein ES319_D12G196900v1 [Gossypium barbadense]|uniref:Uncharacterized protein n=2 Tax=Gossypium TaxID=3633 RepID=A0A5J5P0M1_GOSBA|nr:hypothetical protein ES319_D12G196900v1 [Gossypium barbadense]TYG41825.1 hypothetical protein ES288_D12G207300v1 [Gossypium darwinii]
MALVLSSLHSYVPFHIGPDWCSTNIVHMFIGYLSYEGQNCPISIRPLIAFEVMLNCKIYSCKLSHSSYLVLNEEVGFFDIMMLVGC